MTLNPPPGFAPPFPPQPMPMPPPPAGAFYDTGSVGIATFLGSPIAGTVLMAINYRRMGKPSAGVVAVLLGILATALALGSGFVIKGNSGSSAIAIGMLIATIAAARQLQGPTIDAHRAAGGKIASRWLGAGIGLLIGIVVFGAIILYVVFHSGLPGTRLAIGEDEIYYSGSATEIEARALGDALKKEGFLTNKGVSIQLDKSGGKTTISFVVQDGVWNDEHNVTVFQRLVRNISPSVGGLPITLRFLDSEAEVHKEVVVTPEPNRSSLEPGND